MAFNEEIHLDILKDKTRFMKKVNSWSCAMYVCKLHEIHKLHNVGTPPYTVKNDYDIINYKIRSQIT